MKRLLFLLGLSWIVLSGLAPPARADLLYTWNTTIDPGIPFGPLTGYFTVPEAAISDGLITGPEVTSYSFSDSLAVFAPSSTSFSANLFVNTVTGALLAGGNLGIEEGSGFTLQQLLLFTGPGTQTYLRLSLTPDAGGGEGTWSVAVVPEPASGTLLALGLAGLVGYRWRRRHAAP